MFNQIPAIGLLLLLLQTVFFDPVFCEEDPSKPNILYVPAGTHPVSMQFMDPDTGQQSALNYTVTDTILEYYNTTVKEIEEGRLHKTNASEDLILTLKSGRNIEVHVTERTVVQLIDESGKQNFGVDLTAFNKLTLDDIKGDSTLEDVPQSPESLQWPTSHWRPVRSVTISVNCTNVTVTLNRRNNILNATVTIAQPAVLWGNLTGLAVIVVHTRTSRVTFSRIFPTAEFGGFRDLVEVVAGVTLGRLVIVVGVNDGSLQLQEARQYLQEHAGSMVAPEYRFRDTWAWVFIKGGPTLGETFSPNLVSDKRDRRSGKGFDIEKIPYKKYTDLLQLDIPPRPSLIYNFEKQQDNDAFTHTYNAQAMQAVGNMTPSPVWVDVRVPVHEEPVLLLLEYDICDDWQLASDGNSHWEARVKFCQMHDGYGSLCRCHDPLIMTANYTMENGNETAANNQTKKNPFTKDIPIIIMTVNRTRLLFRLLENLNSQPGVHLGNILVVMDGWQEGAARLAYILGFRLLQHAVEGEGSVRVSRNLRFALYNSLTLYPTADSFIVLEDDLVLSPDFYSYMQHTSDVFPLDNTIYCVSAFNHLSYPHTAYNASQLYRVESFPAYGWMIPRYVVENLLPRWFPSNVTHDWDFMLGMTLLTQRRECIVPDVNRALHGGIVGLHASASWFTERHYSRRNVNMDPNVQLMPVERLVHEAYEKDMAELLQKATVVELEDSVDVKLPPSKSGVYVIYVDQPFPKNITMGDGNKYIDEGPNEPVFKILAEALHIWNTDVRELHDSTWRLHHRNKTLLVVGYPKSSYSRFKPVTVFPATISSGVDKFIFDEYNWAHYNKIPFRIHFNVTATDIWNKIFSY